MTSHTGQPPALTELLGELALRIGSTAAFRGELPAKLVHRLGAEVAQLLETDRSRAEELRAELEERRRKVADAKRELGAARLDGKDEGAAAKRLTAAREEAGRVEAAIAELERRGHEAERKAWEAVIRGQQARAYRWFIDYLELVAAYQRARVAHDEALDRVRGINEVAVVRNYQGSGIWRGGYQALVDEELLRATDNRPLSRQKERELLGKDPLGNLPAERCEELKAKAKSLLAELEGEEEKALIANVEAPKANRPRPQKAAAGRSKGGG